MLELDSEDAASSLVLPFSKLRLLHLQWQMKSLAQNYMSPEEHYMPGSP